jgi:very-short-patch-repair endonuclease
MRRLHPAGRRVKGGIQTRRAVQFHDRPIHRDRRRALRTRGTAAEAVLWTLLQRRQLRGRRFRRQHGAGPYILDFYCPAERLAVELDGAAHFDLAGREYDEVRDAFLRAAGIRVIRFENDMVRDAPEAVLAAIAACFAGPDPPAHASRALSPSSEGDTA